MTIQPSSPVAEDGTRAESGSVALDPKTGGVRALVGRVGSDENPGFRTYNYATQAARSPDRPSNL